MVSVSVAEVSVYQLNERGFQKLHQPGKGIDYGRVLLWTLQEIIFSPGIFFGDKDFYHPEKLLLLSGIYPVL